MRKEDLEFRINKCKETITKKETLIGKREKSIEKKIKELHNLGYKGGTSEEVYNEMQLYRSNNYNEPIFQDSYWIVCDINSYVESIRSAKRAIEDEKEKLHKYENMLEVELSKTDLIDNLPDNIKTFMNEIVNSWNEYDKAKRDNINKYIKEYENIESRDAYREFERKLYERFGRNAFEFRWKTNEQIEKENEREGRKLILDFIDRVSGKTGPIKSFDNLYLNRDNSGYAIINGTVEGVDGIAKVESIYAGGYNIQRLHVRVLVK